jgi:hypothetical protein
MPFLVFGIDVDLLILERLQFVYVDGPDATKFQLLLNVEIIALNIRFEPGDEVDKIFERVPIRLSGKFKLADPPPSHLLEKGLQEGVFIRLHLESDIVEKEIVSNDLDEKLFFRLKDIVDDLETILSEAIDDEVLPVVEGGTFEQTIEADNKLDPHLRREMVAVRRGPFLFQGFLLPRLPLFIYHMTSGSLKESSEKLLDALLITQISK